MTVERRYFRAAGRSLAAVEQFETETRVAEAAAAALMTSIGAEQAEVSEFGDGIRRARFGDNPVPAGWRPCKGRHDWWEPVRKGAEGKARSAALKTPGVPSVRRLTYLLFPDLGGLGGWERFPYVYWATLQVVGEHRIITIPAFATEVPLDAEPLKTSEYWQLREAATAAGSTS